MGTLILGHPSYRDLKKPNVLNLKLKNKLYLTIDFVEIRVFLKNTQVKVELSIWDRGSSIFSFFLQIFSIYMN